MAKISKVKGEGEGVSYFNVYEDEIDGYITIGLKSKTYLPVGETRSYSISYTYDMGKDKNVLTGVFFGEVFYLACKAAK